MAEHNFDFIRGDTFRKLFNLKDAAGTTLSLANYSARMKIKKEDGTLVASFTSDDAINLSNDSPNIAILSSGSTAAWPVGVLVYDFELSTGSSPTIIETIISGQVNVIGDITDA